MASVVRRTWSVNGKRRDSFPAQIRLKGFPSLSKLFPRRSQAVQWARQTEARLLGGATPIKPKEILLRELLRRYRTEVTPHKRGHRPEAYRVAKLELDSIAGYSIASCTASVVADYRDRRLRSVSADSVIKELNLLSAVFETSRGQVLLLLEIFGWDARVTAGA